MVPQIAPQNFRGAILMVLSMAFFAAEDTFIKILTGNLPYLQVLTSVGVLGFAVFFAMLRLKGGRFLTRDLLDPVVVLRTLGEVVGSIAFVIALALSDLSTTSAIPQALPLMVVLGAALFLGEPVGWRRWSAICAGFIGVLLIIRPGGEGFTLVSLLALLGVVGLAVRDLVTRRIPSHIHSDQVSALAFLALAGASMLLAAIMGQGFVVPTVPQASMIAICIVFGVTGYSLLVAATRISEIAAIAPYRYTRLVFALILAFFVFGERPDGMTLIGAVIVVASGCYTMWREARQKRARLRQAGFVTLDD
ncbi:DMT family transporter [Paracoccus sp. DMF-8]|uniref:DMT family transporter n=1 Tax=Paracoccus sp. DMF-8 TaxID=3019445 RepID=UPI0023E7A37D|nr:DMT family transporter [Paracoccus sp. DMF-8]MDF3606986.1 DMT family transporter [Paracoccus sp. DMF-8]